MRQLVRVKTLVGLGAALLLASSIHAQQSVAPSFFDADPSTIEQTPAIEDPAAESVDPIDSLQVAQYTGLSMRLGVARLLVSAAYALSTPRTEESDLIGLRMMDTLLVMILVAGAVTIARYGMTRRYQGLETR